MVRDLSGRLAGEKPTEEPYVNARYVKVSCPGDLATLVSTVDFSLMHDVVAAACQFMGATLIDNNRRKLDPIGTVSKVSLDVINLKEILRVAVNKFQRLA